MKDLELIVENLSEIPAKIILKNSKNKDFSFDNGFVSESSVSNVSSPVSSNNPLIYFCPSVMTLAPISKQTVRVHLKAGQPEGIRELIEVLVQNGESLMIELFAEVQPTILSLNRSFLEFPPLFAGNLYETSSLSKTSLKIQNLGNIPTKFKWVGRLKDLHQQDHEGRRHEEGGKEEGGRREGGEITNEWKREGVDEGGSEEGRMDEGGRREGGVSEERERRKGGGREEDLEYWFEPKEGIIGGKEELNVKFCLKPLRGGKLEDIFVCECEGMDYPIGFEINTIV